MVSIDVRLVSRKSSIQRTTSRTKTADDAEIRIALMICRDVSEEVRERFEGPLAVAQWTSKRVHCAFSTTKALA
jgi:hypothetical protein